MKQTIDVSVVISTYNRCELLPGALASVLTQQARGVNYEVITVDNNSTDRTRAVIEALIAQGATNLRYAFEGRQGAAHGKNAGIALAQGAIIAFTDDDVRVAPDWVSSIKRAFDAHPEVGCVSGKILPRWPSPPPVWLTSNNWAGPLALQDYGDASLFLDTNRPLSLAAANYAFRRAVLERIGVFSPALSVGADKSDTDLLLRFWRAGGRCLYAPEIVVTAEVQSERMTKSFHRRWWRTAGAFGALMNYGEIFDGGGRLTDGENISPRLFGVPAYLYRQLLMEGARWGAATLRGRRGQAFTHEGGVQYLFSYIGARYGEYAATRQRSHLAEVCSFAAELLRRKARGRARLSPRD